MKKSKGVQENTPERLYQITPKQNLTNQSVAQLYRINAQTFASLQAKS